MVNSFACRMCIRRSRPATGLLQRVERSLCLCAATVQTVFLNALHANSECEVPMRHRQYDLPPLDQLEAFEAAARHLSFTRAADELALTQSAVSRQVAALEAFFGVPLFQRLHRALRLSDEGQLLQRTVVDVLQQLHQTSTTLRGEARLKTVVVTTTAGFAGLWLIPRLAGFTASRPDVDVRISATLLAGQPQPRRRRRGHPLPDPGRRRGRRPCACSARWCCRCAARSCCAMPRGR